MNIYNNEYIKKEIMNQSRHQLIYGYNGNNRIEFLKSLEKEYPITFNKNQPMAIYVNDFWLPKSTTKTNDLDNIRLSLASKEYLNFSIIKDIIRRIKESSNITESNYTIENIIDIINKFVINDKLNEIDNLEDFLLLLNESKKYYKDYYQNILEEKSTLPPYEVLKIPFIEIKFIIERLKQIINNNSYFGIILDKQQDISLQTTKSINSLIGSRINKDISIKLVLEPDKWDSYLCSNGQLIEYIHDYGDVELDDSKSIYVKQLKNRL